MAQPIIACLPTQYTMGAHSREHTFWTTKKAVTKMTVAQGHSAWAKPCLRKVGCRFLHLQALLTLYPPPLLVLPHPRETVPRHPLGDGCQVTVPHPPWGTALPPYTHIFRHRNCTAKRKNTVAGLPCLRS